MGDRVARWHPFSSLLFLSHLPQPQLSRPPALKNSTGKATELLGAFLPAAGFGLAAPSPAAGRGSGAGLRIPMGSAGRTGGLRGCKPMGQGKAGQNGGIKGWKPCRERRGGAAGGAARWPPVAPAGPAAVGAGHLLPPRGRSGGGEIGAAERGALPWPGGGGGGAVPWPVAVPRCPGGCGATCRGGGAGGGGGGAEAGRWRSGDAAARSLPAAAAGRGAGGPGEEREEGRGAGQGMGEAPGVAAERCPPPRAAPASPRLSPLQAPEARGAASAEAHGELEAGGSRCPGWERVTGGGSGVPGPLSASPEPRGGVRVGPGGIPRSPRPGAAFPCAAGPGP